MGLMSEAGCPGVAGSGAVIVKLAHEKEFKSFPCRPILILLAMMASGMNGKFYFSWLFTHRKDEKKSEF
jgi:16S rRNA C1402 (ribose-2'-O) methylase RsmI